MPAASPGFHDDDLAGRTILQVAPSLRDGQSGRTIVAIAEALTGAGARALVACDGGELIAELQSRGATAIDLPLGAQGPLSLLRNAYALRRLIRDERVALIHAWSPTVAWSAQLARRGGTARLITQWRMAQAGKRKAFPGAIRLSDALVVSSASAAKAVEGAAGARSPALAVIPAAVEFAGGPFQEVAPARISALRAAWGGSADDDVLLVASAGGSQRVASARALAASHVGRDITLRDLAAEQDIPAALMACRGLIVLADGSEEQVRLVIEAQWRGVPVIVAGEGAAADAVGAPPEVSAPSRSGWRIGADDTGELALAMAEILAMRPSLRDRLAENGRGHVETVFGGAAVIGAYLGLYSRMLAPG